MRSPKLVLFHVVIAALVAAATFRIGWLAPPVCGALTALGFCDAAREVRAREGAASDIPASVTSGRTAALATFLGWGALLVFAASGRGAAALVAALGGLAGARGAAASAVTAAAALLTLALGSALAWASATLVDALLRALPGRRSAPASGRVTLSATPTPAPPGAPDRAPAPTP